jgi:diguanylate cyclase (GGDEF)-like protein
VNAVARQLVAAAALAAVMASVLTVYVHRRVLRRLTALRNSVLLNAMGQPAEIPHGSADEIGDLARSVQHFITHQKTLEDELRQLAVTDPLTGLANRRHFIERAEEEILRYRRLDGAACLLMADLDNFKKINDDHGHGVGDDVIRRFAAVARTVFRDIDVIGRLGGEEFAILMPETDGAGAAQGAERLRRAIEGEHLALPDGRTLSFTVSIGVAALTSGDADVTQLMGHADAALYKAKRQGRNRVEIA